MKARGSRKSAAACPAQPVRDLFGDVPVSFHDIYAWLLCVAHLDPESERAATYVRDWGVVHRIRVAKLDGSMTPVTEAAEKNSRYLELLLNGFDAVPRRNPYGVNEWKEVLTKVPTKRPPMWKVRTKEERDRAQAALKKVREQAKQQDNSMLRRLPRHVPSLELMLADIGNPAPQHLAKAMKVSERTAQRWLAEEQVPHAVTLALFWITRWGASAADANAYNDAMRYAEEAGVLRRRLEALESQLAQVEQIADFGSANDPTPSVAAALVSPTEQSYPVPEALPSSAASMVSGSAESPARARPRRREVRILFDSIERAA